MHQLLLDGARPGPAHTLLQGPCGGARHGALLHACYQSV